MAAVVQQEALPKSPSSCWMVVHAPRVHSSAAEGCREAHGGQGPAARAAVGARSQPEAGEEDEWTVVPDVPPEWEVVPLPDEHSLAFRVRQYPGLGLGLKLGATYTKSELLGRCWGKPWMVEALEKLLRDPACECFEPAPWLQPESSSPSLPDAESLATAVAEELLSAGIVSEASSPFTTKAVDLLLLLQQGPSIVPQAADVLRGALLYPIDKYLATEEGQMLVQTDLVRETAKYLIFAKDSGALVAFASDPAAVQRVAKAMAQARGSGTKELWQPIRFCLTANTKGLRISLSTLFQALSKAEGSVLVEYVPLDRRVDMLRERLGL